MKKIFALLLLTIFCITIIGCGSTVDGIGNDARRMGRGVKTIFVRDGVGE